MRENSRVRERYEISLDGRQVAAIVVGALVVMGAVFVLGLNVGKQLGPKVAPAPRTEAPLAALEKPPEPAPREKEPKLQFHDALTKGPPEAAPIPEPRAAPPAEPGTGTALNALPPAPAAPAAVAAKEPASKREAAARVAPPPRKDPPARKDPVAAAVAKVQSLPKGAPAAGGGPFAIQVGATQTEADARRLAARHEGSRVVPADVPGKGKVWRVKVGSFGSRAEAERRLEELKRGGVKGFVTEG